MGRNFAETLFILLLVGAVLLVFYDVNTSMVEQGIAKGDAYQNSAAYPTVLSIILILCVSLVIFRNFILRRNIEKSNLIFDLKHIQLFIIFYRPPSTVVRCGPETSRYKYVCSARLAAYA